jgi:hypothetical protein
LRFNTNSKEVQLNLGYSPVYRFYVAAAMRGSPSADFPWALGR